MDVSKILTRATLEACLKTIEIDGLDAEHCIPRVLGHDAELRALVSDLLKDLTELAEWGDYEHLLDLKLIARAKECLK